MLYGAFQAKAGQPASDWLADAVASLLGKLLSLHKQHLVPLGIHWGRSMLGDLLEALGIVAHVLNQPAGGVKLCEAR